MTKRYVPSIAVDEPTFTGRTYPREIVEQIAERINDFTEQDLPLTLDAPENGKVDLSRIAGFVRSARIKDDGRLYLDIEMIRTPMGITADVLIDQGVLLSYMPFGTGRVCTTGKVLDYDVAGFSILAKPRLT